MDSAFRDAKSMCDGSAFGLLLMCGGFCFRAATDMWWILLSGCCCCTMEFAFGLLLRDGFCFRAADMWWILLSGYCSYVVDFALGLLLICGGFCFQVAAHMWWILLSGCCHVVGSAFALLLYMFKIGRPLRTRDSLLCTVCYCTVHFVLVPDTNVQDGASTTN